MIFFSLSSFDYCDHPQYYILFSTFIFSSSQFAPFHRFHLLLYFRFVCFIILPLIALDLYPWYSLFKSMFMNTFSFIDMNCYQSPISQNGVQSYFENQTKRVDEAPYFFLFYQYPKYFMCSI